MGDGQKGKITKFLTRLRSSFEEAMFPADYTCLGCGKEIGPEGRESSLCPDCVASLPFKSGKLCAKCGNAIYTGRLCRNCINFDPAFDHAYAPFFYTGIVRKFVGDLKERGNLYMAEYIAEYMFLYYSSLGLKHDLVTAVPNTKKTLRRRGFDHTELIAKAFSKMQGTPYLPLLTRISHRKDQTVLGTTERFIAAHGCFEFKSEPLEGKSVLLIDDVMTSGATAAECARILKENGASQVDVLTLTR